MPPAAHVVGAGAQLLLPDRAQNVVRRRGGRRSGRAATAGVAPALIAAASRWWLSPAATGRFARRGARAAMVRLARGELEVPLRRTVVRREEQCLAIGARGVRRVGVVIGRGGPAGAQLDH